MGIYVFNRDVLDDALAGTRWTSASTSFPG